MENEGFATRPVLRMSWLAHDCSTKYFRFPQYPALKVAGKVGFGA
jgi:hypothetical protein